MKISLLTLRHIEVAYVVHLIDIDTTSHEVGCHEQAEVALTELLVCLLT